MPERTLSEVVKLTGAKRRSVQLWADAQLVHSTEGTDRAGTGVHRRFDDREVKVIALLVPLSNMGLPIGRLRHFVRSFREAFEYDRKKSKRRKASNDVAAPFERAAAGEGKNYLVFAHRENVLAITIVTDKDKPAVIDPAHMEMAWVLEDRTAFMGVINLNAALSGLNG